MLLTLKSLAQEPIPKLPQTPAFSLSTFYAKFRDRNKKPDCETVNIVVVNESIYGSSSRDANSQEMVTVIYDRDSLDSMYALAFFEFIYDGRVQPIPYHHAALKHDVIKPSHETIILGVDLEINDLVHINSLTGSVRIFGYRGSYNYLYDSALQKLFKRVTLFQSDNDYFIGGKNIGKLENSVAMMIKILYNRSCDWSSWRLHRYALSVAHATCFYENIPGYNLTRSVFQVTRDEENGVVQKAKSNIHNNVDAKMHDLKNKLENALNTPHEKMFDIKPEMMLAEYSVYRKRLQLHIDRTRTQQGWMGKGVFSNEKLYAYCVPSISYAIHDIIALSCNNVDTTVCVEDAGDRTIYYIFSKVDGKANRIARLIGGDKTWIKGRLVCTSKLKEINNRH